nr:venom protein [Lampona murina]
MKVILVLSLVAVVICAELQAEERGAAVFDSNDEGRSRLSDCKALDQLCNNNCSCCGKNTYCNWNSKCKEGTKDDCIKKRQSNLCSSHLARYGPC